MSSHHKKYNNNIAKKILEGLNQDLLDERILNWIKTVSKNKLKKELYIYKKTSEKKVFEKHIDEIRHIVDYLRSDFSPKRIDRLSYEDAKRLAEEWVKRINKRSSIKELKDDVRVISELEDGYKIVELITEKSYLREGKLMSHCVSSYFESKSKIFSIRNDENIPKCTIELSPYAEDLFYLEQLEGFANEPIKQKYIKYCQQGLIKLFDLFKIKKNYKRDRVFKQIELIEINKGFLSHDELFNQKSNQEKLIVDSDLSIKEKEKIFINRDIEFNENIYFENIGEIYISKNVKFNANLTFLNIEKIIFEKGCKLDLKNLSFQSVNKIEGNGKFLKIKERLTSYKSDTSFLKHIEGSVKCLDFSHCEKIKTLSNVIAEEINLYSSSIKYINEGVFANILNLKDTTLSLKNISKSNRETIKKIVINKNCLIYEENKNKISFHNFLYNYKPIIKFKLKKFKETRKMVKNKKQKVFSFHPDDSKSIYGIKEHSLFFGTTGRGKSSNWDSIFSQKSKVNKNFPIVLYKEKNRYEKIKEDTFNYIRQKYALLSKTKMFKKIKEVKETRRENKKPICFVDCNCKVDKFNISLTAMKHSFYPIVFDEYAYYGK